MSKRNTVIRSLHDLGAAVWLGGALMGAVGLNGAAADIPDSRQRARIAADGWARWSPVNAGAIAAHLIGGLGLVVANRGRVRDQSGVTANTTIKTIVTAVAVATTAYSGLLGSQIAKAGAASADGATEPDAGTPAAVATAQNRLRIMQWATPILTAAIVAMGAQQGEQQRGSQILTGLTKKARKKKS